MSNWWLTVSIDNEPIDIPYEKTDPIGIDLGVKDLSIDSENRVMPNINKSTKMIKLENKRKRLQRKNSKKRGENCRRKSKNYKKLEKEIKKIYKKMSNIRLNYIHQITSEYIEENHRYICIEDLDVNQIKKHNKNAQYQALREFRRQLEYKSSWYNVQLIIADKWYASSKTCHNCGHKKTDLKLSDRVYICSECGYTEDRDYNAALNLRDYPKSDYYNKLVA